MLGRVDELSGLWPMMVQGRSGDIVGGIAVITGKITGIGVGVPSKRAGNQLHEQD